MLTASIIIPAYRADFIGETILSIANQTIKPKEVILLYNIYPDEDVNSKINRGISLSTADSFIVLGDDDKIHPEFVEKTLAKMEETNADIIYTDMEQFGVEPGIHRPGHHFELDRFPENFGIFFTSLTKKSIWERVGGYDVMCGPFCDWDFWWMCAEHGAKAVYLNEPLFQYRRHSSQDSQNLSNEMCKWSRDYILEKHKNTKLKPQRHK